MKRLWVGQNLGGLIARREAEAALFETGLASSTPLEHAESSTPTPESDADRLNDAELAGLGT